MANSTHRTPHLLGLGAGAVTLRGIRSNTNQYVWSPEFWWHQRIKSDGLGLGTQTTLLTIPAAGFASSEVSLTYSGGPLSGPVVVTETALEGVANTTFAQTIDDAIEAESALDDFVSATAASNIVTMAFTPSQGLIDVALVVTMAQVEDLQFGGTLIDGDYTATLTGGGLGAPVVVTVPRVAGTPANVAAMAVAMETAIEALVGSTLAGVVQSADDDTVDTNAVLMVPAITAVTIATTVPAQTFTDTFGGAATDGNYSTTFTHPSLAGGSVTVTTVRSTTPSTNDNLATQHASDIEGHSALFGLVDDVASVVASSVYTIQTHAGITGLAVETSAPSPGTLTAAETSPTLTAADGTPSSYAAALANSVALTMNTAFPQNNVFSEVVRGHCALFQRTAFDSGTTVNFGDAGLLTGLFSLLPVDGTGWTGDLGTIEGSDDIHEPAWDPILTINSGESLPTVGEFELFVILQKHQTGQ